MKKVFSMDFNGRNITIETGELAKQTNGSVLVRYGDTAVLSVCVMGKTMVSQDFFPLQVLYFHPYLTLFYHCIHNQENI